MISKIFKKFKILCGNNWKSSETDGCQWNVQEWKKGNTKRSIARVFIILLSPLRSNVGIKFYFFYKVVKPSKLYDNIFCATVEKLVIDSFTFLFIFWFSVKKGVDCMKYLINSVGENLESNEHKISFMRHTRKAKCFRFFWKNIPLEKI